MKLSRFALISIVSVIILMMGCSSSDNKPAKSSNPPAVAAQPEVRQPVLYTGVEAFNHMIGLAMKWAPDAQPARLEAVLTPEATGQNGRATIWRGYFASPSRRAVKTIVCSGSRRPDAPPFGTSTEGNDGPYNADAANLAFLSLLVKTDTDKAFEIAQQPVTYVLLKDRKQNVPVWYVTYGSSEHDRKGIGVINATTGAFVSAGK